MHHDLLSVVGLDAGELTPVIDRSYPLSEAADAMRYLDDPRARGRAVLLV